MARAGLVVRWAVVFFVAFAINNPTLRYLLEAAGLETDVEGGSPGDPKNTIGGFLLAAGGLGGAGLLTVLLYRNYEGSR